MYVMDFDVPTEDTIFKPRDKIWNLRLRKKKPLTLNTKKSLM